MTSAQPAFFLLALDLTDRAVEVASFADAREASRALAAAEDARGARPLASQVVLLQAEDLAAVEAAHAHFFTTTSKHGARPTGPMLITELLPDLSSPGS